MRAVYADYSATTALDKRWAKVMGDLAVEGFYNPSTLYAEGRKAKKELEKARVRVAGVLGCGVEEVVFTSGGTESDNLALRGVMEAQEKGRLCRGKLIVSVIEHHAVLNAAEDLKKRKFKVKYLPVDGLGFVDLKKLERWLTQKTCLVSVMYANNEIGTVQPIVEIAKLCHAKGALLHVDAVQAVGALSLDVKKLGVDLLSLSAHKFYGPKGVGVLYVRKGVKLRVQAGGSQESGRRGGTENVPGIVAMSLALEEAEKKREKEAKRLSELRDYFIKEVLKRIPDARLNGDAKKRLPGLAHFSFAGVEGEALLLRLDEVGVMVSTASACSSNKLQPSHVLEAIKLNKVVAHGSVRFSFGRGTTKAEVDYILKVLPKVVSDLREMSPLYEPGLLKKLKA